MTPAIELLCRALSRRDGLSPEEIELLASLTQKKATFAKGTELISAHSRAYSSCLVTSGLTARAVMLEDGRRQLTALHVPGDFVDLHALLLKVMDHSVVAMTNCSAVFIPHADLTALTEKAPHLTRLLWLSTTVDAAIQREMIASIGRRTPLKHLCHLICELYLRFEVVGLAESGRFQLALTQSDVADVLGLSVVHTNRTIRALRATGFVSWRNFDIEIKDFERLADLAGFDPTYLSLVSEPR
ncbi:MAG: Crp/Fnr family transcriptional regulator [Alphaproteobacteria bacterium]|nr:Crp/Fnr family transcriptional regulator [Alphaproteobacteria bacterium]MBU0805991.1 Crp/Fnr family transcriptional regulator [Alphaproteobacteria bacterium]MBU0874040.1 Crp/Fnr family transcriptional regulator [Alphaproteobacteria bacterium]MBU1402136.1 Crp/Fnr family transcriptional regulator [Alphaproteobacteria bacterium]MBU1590781.1 Crp/Fnr family transcriptional regulator [Alphaproteobacteria bacterium]